MPLRALQDNESIFAFDYDEQSWSELKRTYKDTTLQMPCCGNGAIPKTSKIGNYFFSHKHRGDCQTAPESQEHIYLKTLVAKAAKGAGWLVSTEWPGTDGSGKRWVADVFCEKNTARVVLEIQMSYQAEAELASRQETYANSGVRAAWFLSSEKFRNRYTGDSKALPVFYVLPSVAGAEPIVKGFDVSVSKFVLALMSKRVAWEVEPEEQSLLYIDDSCWKCGGDIKQGGFKIEVQQVDDSDVRS